MTKTDTLKMFPSIFLLLQIPGGFCLTLLRHFPSVEPNSWLCLQDVYFSLWPDPGFLYFCKPGHIFVLLSLLSNNFQGPSFSFIKSFHTNVHKNNPFYKWLFSWCLLVWFLGFLLNYTKSCLKVIGDFQLPWPGAKWLQEGGEML